jgi:anti-sigma factor ChrR (cupin superfamily)
MERRKIDDMVKGWFIGNFEPTMLATNDVEVAVKRYRRGDREARHYHKIATEFTAVISGEVEMNGLRYSAGDVVRVDRGESTDFLVLSDAVTVVVKHPGASNDKYWGEVND